MQAGNDVIFCDGNDMNEFNSSFPHARLVPAASY
jgi:hypothetical protein